MNMFAGNSTFVGGTLRFPAKADEGSAGCCLQIARLHENRFNALVGWNGSTRLPSRGFLRRQVKGCGTSRHQEFFSVLLTFHFSRIARTTLEDFFNILLRKLFAQVSPVGSSGVPAGASAGRHREDLIDLASRDFHFDGWIQDVR